MITGSTGHCIKDNKAWLVGNFAPSIFKTKKFEVCLANHKAGEPTQPHKHDKTNEINVILGGKVRVKDQKLVTGDYFIFGKGEYSDVEFLEDTFLLILRDGSFPEDKTPL